MGERRKRKSLWDKEDDTKYFSGLGERNSWREKEHHSSHDSGRSHEFSAPRTNAGLRSRDQSGQLSGEPTEENPVSPVNGSSTKNRQRAPERKEIGGENRDYQNMSPGFDGMDRNKYNHALENDRRHSQNQFKSALLYGDRHLERGRSRSRSRSRTRGRSRSRSLSRGRGRERERERGRGRGRSRSRSRSDGSARGQSRSRSPIGDNNGQSYGWSDRRSIPDKSSQICRDFASGRCKRGSQCKFFHPNNVSGGDGDLARDDPPESWRNRADRGQISRHSHSRGAGHDLQGDVSDRYRGDDEQHLNKGRSAVPCKGFMKGNCRWGDTCRFSHHFASDETSGKGPIKHQPYKNGKPLCKLFAAGKCDRDNCRFSHEDPKLNSLEGWRGDDHSLDDKSNQWNGPTWNDASRSSDNVKPGGLGETIDTKAKNHNRLGHDLENEKKGQEISEWIDNSIHRDKQPSPPGERGSYGGDVASAESIGKEDMAINQEHLLLHGSLLQHQDGNLGVHGKHTLQEDQSFSMKAWQQNVSPVPHIQQQHHGGQNNIATSLQSGVLDELKDSRNATHPDLLSGQNLNQNSDNVLHGQGTLFPNLSNAGSNDLHGPETNKIAPPNMQSQMQSYQNAVLTKPPLNFPNLLTTEHLAQLTNSAVAIAGQHVAPMTNPAMFPPQGFGNDQSQKNADTEGSGSQGMTPSFNSISLQSNPVGVSHDPINPMQNGIIANEHGNYTEQNNQMQVGHISVAGTEPENSKVAHPQVGEGNLDIGEENKGVDNNKQTEALHGSGKVEESNANKDDKGMRIFKNSLIEFVKDILKPTWKEGRMSREVHKTIVKKVVDKITSTIQADHVPRTQDKVEQYLSYSKPKIAKLVQAYVGRCLKTDS